MLGILQCGEKWRYKVKGHHTEVIIDARELNGMFKESREHMGERKKDS